MRFSIDEYAQRFKMSKEMIHARMRNKRLNYIIEDGTTYIIVPRSAVEPQEPPKSTTTPQPPAPAPKKNTIAAIIALYQKENRHLKERIKLLEAKIDKLIDDKERMLIEERRRIEQLYAHKDEQLKSILELLNTKMLTSQNAATVHDVNIEERADTFGRLVELKRYLKTLELSSDERKTIKRRFALAYGNDIRIIQQNGAFFLDFSKYDYSDLLNI